MSTRLLLSSFGFDFSIGGGVCLDDAIESSHVSTKEGDSLQPDVEESVPAFELEPVGRQQPGELRGHPQGRQRGPLAGVELHIQPTDRNQRQKPHKILTCDDGVVGDRYDSDGAEPEGEVFRGAVDKRQSD